MMGNYAKFIISVLGVVVMGLQNYIGLAIPDVVIGLVAALGVYVVPNK